MHQTFQYDCEAEKTFHFVQQDSRGTERVTELRQKEDLGCVVWDGGCKSGTFSTPFV